MRSLFAHDPYICSKIIASIQYCRADRVEKEENIKSELGQRYFEEIYSRSDEYIEKQIEEAQARDEYCADHPPKNMRKQNGKLKNG